MLRLIRQRVLGLHHRLDGLSQFPERDEDFMPQLSLASWILVVVVGLFTAIAAIWDFRQYRIPNKLTLPVFFAGWVYQAVFHGWPGIGNAAGGFLVGFGVLFLLWIVGGGGGGDVKLMGALSVWLGYKLTLIVLMASTVAVIFGTTFTMVWSVFTKGVRGTKTEYLAKAKNSDGKPRTETAEEKQRRRIMGYSLPVFVATWIVMAWKLPTLDQPVAPAPVPAQTVEAA
jgi:prepilin peptidase CpaA